MRLLKVLNKNLLHVLTLPFAFTFAISAYANTGRNVVWNWTDRNGQTHNRSELMQILDANRKWILSRRNDGAPADLHEAKLAGADLRKADLSGVNLRGADLSSADMTEASVGIGNLAPSPPSSFSVRLRQTDPNGPPNFHPFYELFVSFLRAQRFSSQANTECDWQSTSDPNAADFSQVNLHGAVLTKAHFVGTNLTGADIEGAKLSEAIFQNVEFWDAELSGSTLDHAIISTSHLFNVDLTGADLTSVSFLNSDLNFANLKNAKLSGATFTVSELCQSNFEPATIPTDLNSLVYARGLELLTFVDHPEALITLRQRFRDSGFRSQERKITFALKSHDEVEYWTTCSQGFGPACIDLFLNQWLFNWTCNYGLRPERALVLLIEIWFDCGLVYWCFLRFSRRPGLYLIPSRCLNTGAITHPQLQRLMPKRHFNRCSGRVRAHTSKGLWLHIRRYARSLRRDAKQTWPLLRAAFFFSTMSAFNIGFRGFAGGRWLRQLTKREYQIKAQGWPRVIAGFQALASVGLLALWILTYFGRPFG